jgi:hypothetical protein
MTERKENVMNIERIAELREWLSEEEYRGLSGTFHVPYIADVRALLTAEEARLKGEEARLTAPRVEDAELLNWLDDIESQWDPDEGLPASSGDKKNIISLRSRLTGPPSPSSEYTAAVDGLLVKLDRWHDTLYGHGYFEVLDAIAAAEAARAKLGK